MTRGGRRTRRHQGSPRYEADAHLDRITDRAETAIRYCEELRGDDLCPERRADLLDGLSATVVFMGIGVRRLIELSEGESRPGRPGPSSQAYTVPTPSGTPSHGRPGVPSRRLGIPPIGADRSDSAFRQKRVQPDILSTAAGPPSFRLLYI